MTHVTRLRAVAAASAASLLVIGGGVATATAASAKVDPGRRSIDGTHPAWATSKALVSSKPVTSGTVTANVYLASPDASGLATFATAVSTPGSAEYGHFLSAAQVQAQYAPDASEAQAVSQWAAGQHLSVAEVVPGIGGYVQVTGSATAIANAFGVTFGSIPTARRDGPRAGGGRIPADVHRRRRGGSVRPGQRQAPHEAG